MTESPQVVVALLTPFAPNGSLDTGALKGHVDFLADAGVDGLLWGHEEIPARAVVRPGARRP